MATSQRTGAHMPLLLALTLLVVADCIMTTIAVGQMGATELNPICGWTGLNMFMALKIIVSACVIGMFAHLGTLAPRTAIMCLSVLCVLYAGVTMWNIRSLLHV